MLRENRGLIILYLSLILLVPASCAQTQSVDNASNQIQAAPAAAVDGPEQIEPVTIAEENESSRQLRIYADTLLQGASDTIRLDAAMGLLIRKDLAAQEVLLGALSSQDNPMAQAAVCRALIKGRTLGTAVASPDVFLKPLLEVIKRPDPIQARLAAEALLVFRFDRISGALSDIAGSTTAEKPARLNAIYAFQLRPEPEALRSLIKLLDDPDAEIVRAAEIALQESFGVPVGSGKEVWAKILKDLDQKDPAEIRRERLLRQEMRLREIQAERDRWQKLYLSVLDKEFESIDAASRAAYLQERLGSDLPAVRLWALEKLQRFTAESAAGLRDKLLTLLFDENRQIRLATAKALSTMSALNPAEKLLSRYKEESDPQVAMAIFEALGEACFFAFSPGSKITLPTEIKTQALQIADGYTAKEDPEMAKTGAEILRKLLELDGLTPQESQYYLQVILDRYTAETRRKGPIRGELLTTMARLCIQGTQKAEAVKLYTNTFTEVLRSKDENNLVRQAAAMGIMNSDKTAAMQIFRELNLNSDSSPGVRLVMIELAAQMGTTEDLEWLFSQLGQNGQTEPAWQAILGILQRQEAKLIVDWANRVEENPAIADQTGELLELAEQKATAQEDALLLSQLQVRLLKWYWSKGQYEQAILYRSKIMQKDIEKDYVQDALRQTDSCVLDAYLELKLFPEAAEVAFELLKRNLLTQNSEITGLINVFFASENNTSAEKTKFLDVLTEIPISAEQGWWQEKLEQWRSLIAAQADINS